MADSFSKWLAIREPADSAARSTELTLALIKALGDTRPLNVLDLGCGTGANVRYLAPLIQVPQRWLLVDRDPMLLAEAPILAARWAAARGDAAASEQNALVIRGLQLDLSIETRCLDLGTLTDSAMFEGRHLVTASALLDLVSDTWLRALARRCREAGAAVLFALTYNGWSRCTPEEPEDDVIRALMNQHQRGHDIGFGTASGPDGTDHAARAFAAQGYHVQRARCDWVVPPEMPALQRELFAGWAQAAGEIASGQTAMVDDWLTRRLAHVEAGRSRVSVGHEDLVGWLPAKGDPPE